MIITGETYSGPEVIRTQNVVIGSGAGGATTARLLAKAGEEVIVLEEGGNHETAAFAGSQHELMKALYRDSGVTPILSKPNIAYAEGRCLGGSTVINGAIMWRTPEDILERWSGELGLPRMKVAEMSPLFDAIEKDLNVSIQTEADGNKASRLLADASKDLGWRCDPSPRAQKSCRNSNRCPTGCPTGAKQSMLVSYVPDAVSLGARFYCDCRVSRILMEGNRATGVEAFIGTRRLTVHAERIFVCGGPIQTPFLLHGSGIGNRVGESLQIHFNIRATARFAEAVNPLAGTIMTFQVREFADEGMYFGSSNFDPVYLALSLVSQGRETMEEMIGNWQRTALYVAQVKCTGKARVRRFPLMGSPVSTYRMLPADVDRIRTAIKRLAELLLSAGAETVYFPVVGSAPITSMDDVEVLTGQGFKPSALELLSVHGMASCPMGVDSGLSTVDPFGRIHGVKNVYLNDASMLPEGTGINPQLTIMAVAQRNVSEILHNSVYAR